MRVPVTVCILGALGTLFGGWLVGRWCLGLALIAEGALAVWWAVFQFDDGQEPQAHEVPALEQVLNRARAS